MQLIVRKLSMMQAMRPLKIDFLTCLLFCTCRTIRTNLQYSQSKCWATSRAALGFHILDPRPIRDGWAAIGGGKDSLRLLCILFLCLVEPLTSLYKLGVCTIVALSGPSGRRS